MTTSSCKRRVSTSTTKKSKSNRPSKWPQCDLSPLFDQEKISKKRPKRSKATKVSEFPRNGKRTRRHLCFEGQKSILESLNEE
eukprot:CCRYP_017968-RA/>CCRYP_017968-RA protein AED:0.46 eAED:0.46 QI:0/-1/0/1/-1/1/1/0/82